MVYRDTSSLSSDLVQLHSDSSLQIHSNILCIIRDLTNAQNTCKHQSITLPSTYTLRQFLNEIARLFSYEENTFLVKWKCANDLINITQWCDTPRTLSEIGLMDGSKRNQFEIHEKDDGPPVRVHTEQQVVTYDDMYTTRHIATSTCEESTLSNSLNNGYVGLINQAMTCYLNSLLQTLYMTPEFRNAIYKWHFKGTHDEACKNIAYQLQKLFLKLQLTLNKRAVETNELTQAFGWSSDDAFQQHDVQELCRVMFDALERTFKGTTQENLINELYQGVVKDFVKCKECNTENARYDVYLDIQLSIIKQINPTSSDLNDSKYYTSLEEALDAHVECELLDGANKYKCSVCDNRLCVALKGFSFQTIPYILCIQLKRFDYDYRTMSRVKLNAHLRFPFKLDMSKYLSGTCGTVSTVDGTLSTVDSTLSTVDDSLSTVDGTKHSTVNDASTEYELFSIMIHSGSAIGGHYYAYIKNLDECANDEWYQFNDERVTRLSADDLTRAYGVSYSTYSSTSAYMLFYRQINTKKNETFMKSNELPEHLQCLLEQEKRLKEDLANQIKIKCLAQETNIVKVLKINKTHSLEIVKYQLAHEFSIDLGEYAYARLVKYDFKNELKLVSLSEDSNLTLNDILSSSEYSSIGLLLEYTHVPFVEYFTEDSIICKLVSIDLQNYETNERVLDDFIRLRPDATYNDLISLVRLRQPHVTITHLAYQLYSSQFYILNEKSSLKLKTLLNARINCIYFALNMNDESGEDECVDLRESRFYYALNTILVNLIQVSVYLPTEEQCLVYKRRQARRLDLLKSNQFFSNSKMCIGGVEVNVECGGESTLSSSPPPPSYDEVIQTQSNSLKRRFSFDGAHQATNADGRRNATTIDELSLNDTTHINKDKSHESSLDNLRGSCTDLNVADLSGDEECGGMRNERIESFNRKSNDADDDDDDDAENWDDEINNKQVTKMDVNESAGDYHDRFIKSILNDSNEFGTRILDIRMDKRITLYELKKHLISYLDIDCEQFRVFRICSNDVECELTQNESPFVFSTSQPAKLMIKLGAALKFGEYQVPVYKLNKQIGFTYLLDFTLTSGMSVYDHKVLLIEDLRDECGVCVSDVNRLRLRKKVYKQPSTILLDAQIVGVNSNDLNDDQCLFNNRTELCIEELSDEEPKKHTHECLIYTRKWSPSTYELGTLDELLLSDQSYENLLKTIAHISHIDMPQLEVYKCRREYPYKSCVLDLHRDLAWTHENYLSQMTNPIEDGQCFYYRDKREPLGELSDERRRDLESEDSANFKNSLPTTRMTTTTTATASYRKETGIKIHV